jgi:Domain of unknown function (DUF4340)
MDTNKKLYIALALLAALGGGIYLQNKKEKAVTLAHSYEAKNADLPAIPDAEKRKGIDTIELTRPPEKDDKKTDEAKAEEKADEKAAEAAGVGKTESVTLKKKGEEAWELTSPLTYTASASNVKSLLENLDKLKVSERISSTAADYEKYGLTDDKAIHAVFKQGTEVVFDAYFGETGSRGQMVRFAGKDGVYALKGYSKYIYNRDLNGWRDKAIFKFDDKAAAKVTIENEHGTFLFEKAGDKWSGKHKESKPAAQAKDIPEFKPSKVDDLVRAFKGLNASSFADGKTPAEVGLDKPLATLTIELTGGSGKYVVQTGGISEGTSRWILANTSPQIFGVSSWTADWTTAEVSKFQEKKDDKNKKDEGAAPEGEEPEDAPAIQMPGHDGE